MGEGKTFKISFPVYGTGYNNIKLSGEELKSFEAMNDSEKKAYLMAQSCAPSLCFECNNGIEEVEIDEGRLGDDQSNVEFWEDEESYD
jgi:hypothetical protein